MEQSRKHMAKSSRNEKGNSCVSSYCDRDKEVIQYDVFDLDGLVCRGKKPVGSYFSAIGGAQTFGCYTKTPYCKLLSEMIKKESLNLGFAGVGPLYHLHASHWDYINKSRFCIVQVMSARSESNSQFMCNGENKGIYKNKEITPLEFWNLNINNKQIISLVEETRNNYINNMKLLLNKIKVPKILFYFSERGYDYEDSYDSVYSLWNKFPQLVNAKVINDIKGECDVFVECITNVGMPQKLLHPIKEDFLSRYYPKHKGAGSTSYYNTYYPSPEMHVEAAKALYYPSKNLLKEFI